MTIAATGTSFCHQRGGEPWSEWFMRGSTRCFSSWGWASIGTPSPWTWRCIASMIWPAIIETSVAKQKM